MRTLGKIIGIVIFYGAGFLMFVFWFLAMSKWLGFLGAILAFLVAPGAMIFPFVFWIVEGVFPTTYFLLWGFGLIGGFIFALCREDEGYYPR